MKSFRFFHLLCLSCFPSVLCEERAICIGNALFTYDDEVIVDDYDQGIAFCQGKGAQLASVRNREEFDTLLSTILVGATKLIWLGLDRRGNIGDPLDPATFDFLDDFPDKSFFDVGRGNLPWGADRPNNDEQIDGEKECIA